MQTLSGSVGMLGVNRRADVRLVQTLLLRQGKSPGPIDGRCGRLTIGAILAFQQNILSRPDGRVDPRGPTLRRLGSGMPAPAPAQAAAPPPPPSSPPRSSAASANPSSPRAAAPPAAAPARVASAPTRSVTPATRRSVLTPPAPSPVVASAAPAPVQPAVSGGRAVNYRTALPLPARASINIGLSSPGNSQMRQLLGDPRASYNQECRPPTNERIKDATVTQSVGPFRATGLRPAVESLARVMADIRREQPDVYDHLGTVGMMCCRNVRGSSTSVSNHSWGTAVDVTIDGQAQPRGDRRVWLGYALIAPIFNRHGWYWGAGYRTTDAHHFECGAALIQSFRI